MKGRWKTSIVWKLTGLLTGMLTLLVVTVTFLQFFLVSRNYLTSDYTEERTQKLKKEAQQLDQGPFAQGGPGRNGKPVGWI